MRWSTVRTMRWVMVGLGLVAGLALLAAGATLVGAILTGLAAVRIVMLLALSRHRPSAAREGAGRGGRRGELLLRLARNELDVAATAIGIGADELRRAVDDGRTISAMAADAGIPSRQVVDAVVRDARAKVERAVAAGDVAPNRARVLQQRLPHWAERFVLNTPAMLAGAPART